MSTANNQNIVEEIKSRCNIVDVIGRVVTLKKTGSNYKGVCPFHNEKTPSFVVSETKQIYTCFGCGATGDVIEFVQRYYQLEFVPAIEKLASEYGIDVKFNYGKSGKNKDEAYNINREAAKFFYRALREQKNPGYEYMTDRGITPDILNKFGIGYADDKWNSLYDHLKAKGFKKEKLLDLGLISESKGKYYDKFRNRVIFPILNTNGKVIGFGGRIIGDGQPKYLNSQETVVFSKKNNLYGLNITRQEISKEDRAILVEGYMDAISLYQNGVRNVAASLGTALTEAQGRLLKRYTKNIVLSYDADEAGQKAALRGVDILNGTGCRPKVLRINQGKDPDDFIKEKGKAAFLELADEALPLADYKFATLLKQYDISNMEERVDFLQEAVKVLRELSPVEADMYIKKLSSEMKIPEGTVRMEFERSLRDQKVERPEPRRTENKRSAGADITSLEKNIIKLMITDGKFIEGFMPYEKIFSGRSGTLIYTAIREQYRPGTDIDLKKLLDGLDDETRAVLENIDKNVRLAGKEDEVFKDCIKSIEEGALVRKEKELLTRLSMADEEENKENIEVLMRELMDIQKKLKK